MSRKRGAENQGQKGDAPEAPELEELEFEDPYADEYEEEDDENVDSKMTVEPDAGSAEVAPAGNGQPQVVKQVWKSGVEKLEDIEDLEYDPSAYIMYHAMQTEWPCLSFDFLKDDLGDTRHRVSS
jgi:ribosome assembly protein RRB1